jgi:outer membrane murein-binding lipoprotein Lpp
MKKLALLVLVAVGVFTLSGCVDTDTITEDANALSDKVTALETKIDAQKTTVIALETEIAAANDYIDELEAQSAALLSKVNETNTKIKNALNRDTWVDRKVKYNADYTSYDAEYCFGIFDEDWSTITANDYTHNTGLKFVITIEQVVWGTEVFAKDSCGNYSEFIFDNSSYGLYSVPVDFFETGKTYEVVLYKETYFTTPQLGLLPAADMGDFGAYPTDLTAIVKTEVQ